MHRLWLSRLSLVRLAQCGAPSPESLVASVVTVVAVAAGVPAPESFETQPTQPRESIHFITQSWAYPRPTGMTTGKAGPTSPVRLEGSPILIQWDQVSNTSKRSQGCDYCFLKHCSFHEATLEL